jgi:hypothetical protein
MNELKERLKKRYKDINIYIEGEEIIGRKRNEYFKNIFKISLRERIYIITINIWKEEKNIKSIKRETEDINKIEELIEKYYN